MPKKKIWALLFALISWLVFDHLELAPPEAHSPAPVLYGEHASKEAQLYANQNRDDLTQLYLDAIAQARRSVHLVIYALTDPRIITALRTQSQKGISVHVVADAKASPQLDQKLGPKATVVRRFGPGLTHQKLLAIDGHTLLVGSANLTSESLRMHGNLVTVVQSEEAARLAIQKAETLKIEGVCEAIPCKRFRLGSQEMECWFLPDNRHAARRIKELLASAKKTVQVAMFTWTHKELAQAVIQAAERGVKVDLVIDGHSGKGASDKIVKLLKQKGMNIALSQGGPLLHHKFLLIDGEILVNGSTNWTRAAFNQNDDCFIVLDPLTDLQKKQMQRLWTTIKKESEPQ